MNNDFLQLAFQLLADLRDGVVDEEGVFTNEQVHLMHKLCDDLLPGRSFDLNNSREIISDLYRVDGFWNKKCQAAINDFYHLSEMGQTDSASEILRDFTEVCPSVWYCEIIKSL